MVGYRRLRRVPSRFHPVRVTLAGLILALLLGLAGGVQAQSEDDVWGTPVNLSRSGAAGQPRVVAAPDGTLQAFWWDRFDGLMTAVFNGRRWSSPVMAPILMTEVAGNTPYGWPSLTRRRECRR
jgi:hypothetical protein